MAEEAQSKWIDEIRRNSVTAQASILRSEIESVKRGIVSRSKEGFNDADDYVRKEVYEKVVAHLQSLGFEVFEKAYQGSTPNHRHFKIRWL